MATKLRRKHGGGPGRAERKGISLLQLLALFPDEDTATKWFENIRWREGRFCPHCGSVDTRAVPRKRPQPYRCVDCRGYFSVKTGTVMQSSKLPLRTWAFGIYLMSTSLKGVSSMKLHRDLGITQKTAWMMAHKIRQGWLAHTRGKLSGTVEVDETYVGGLERNKHWDKKLRVGRGTVGKTAIVGAKSRSSGLVRVSVVRNVNRRTLHGFVNEVTASGSRICTDDHKGYDGLHMHYRHGRVAHSKGQYADGDIHTNGIESFWAPIKRAHKGVYHQMSRKHLHRYATEFAGRHNLRGLDNHRPDGTIGARYGKETFDVEAVDGAIQGGCRVLKMMACK